ncbi:MAG: EamA family transporter [Terrimicrobiaceae bacterium]|nr:EamA family transporter [Terrimicrobiaceae bacterium]
MSGQAALLWLPAIAAPGYALAAMFLKRALSAGCGQAQVNLAANLMPALLFQTLWFWAGPVDWSHAWEPAAVVVAYFVGQIFAFRALRHGEVSVATPLLGTKVLFTAVFSAIVFGQALAARWWVGAAASTCGVILVTGATWRMLAPRLLRPDALYSVGAAAAFGLTDVLVQHWTRHLGVLVFVPIMFGLVGAVSVLVFVPREGGRILAMPRQGVVPLLVGSAILGIQGLGMATAIGLHDSATVVNIIYSSRAVWSVVLAWLLARTLGMDEAHDAGGVLMRRLAGSMLLFAAVIVVLL